MISHWLLPCAAAAALAAPALPHLAIAHSSDVHLLARLPRAAADALLQLLARPRAELVLTSESLRPLLGEDRRRAHARGSGRRGAVQPMGIAEPPPAAPGAPTVCGGPPPRAPVVVLFVGRLVPVKGVDRLLRAAVLLARPATVVIVGDGPERPALERLADELGCDARFVGQQTGVAKQAWYDAADIFALPSVVLPDGRGRLGPGGAARGDGGRPASGGQRRRRRGRPARRHRFPGPAGRRRAPPASSRRCSTIRRHDMPQVRGQRWRLAATAGNRSPPPCARGSRASCTRDGPPLASTSLPVLELRARSQWISGSDG